MLSTVLEMALGDPSLKFLLVALGALLLLIEIKFYTHMISGLAGAVLLGLGVMGVLGGPRGDNPAIAAGVAIGFGAITVFLGHLGMKARRNKAATGLASMVGEVGVTQTEIALEGMVIVRGEYWKAHSDHAIEAGKRVAVERVKDLVVFVREA